MIEHPEAVTLSRQMAEALRGRRIRRVERGNSPHRFAFYSGSPREYEEVLTGKTLGDSRPSGSFILTRVEPSWTLLFGCGGERILLHPDHTAAPARHQFRLDFQDGASLSVRVQGWGFAQLVETAALTAHPHLRLAAPSPLEKAFTPQGFDRLFREAPPADLRRPIKHFLLSKPGIYGLGNGYLQDILFRAGLHPRRRAGDLTAEDRGRLHAAVVRVFGEAAAGGGRDTETDLHGRRGGYRCVMDRRAAGEPCPACGAPVRKIAFLGGACYFCPDCQPEP